MKTLYSLFILLALSANLQAQTYTLNWGSGFTSAWLDGNTSGTANNIGSSLVNATVNVNNTQSWSFLFFQFSFGGFSSPKVASSPFTTQLGSNVPNMAIGVDWWDKADYIDITINFSQVVKNVTFNVADIDKLNANSSTYFDEIVVTGTNSGLPVTNPALTKLVAASNYVNISGNRATANTTYGQGGNSASSTTDQNGTVTVNFGSTFLTSVNIRYRNNSASQSDPDPQAIAIGNISFQRAVALPLQLISFNGNTNNNRVQLNWLTAQEASLDKFIVEKSTDAVNWQLLSTVTATGNSNSTKEYSTIDAQPMPVNYYRLKQVNMDGSFTYSQTIRLRNEAIERAGIKWYPNPVTNTATVTINSDKKQSCHIKLYNQSGIPVHDLSPQLTAGSNNINICGVALLPPGVYIVHVEDGKNNRIGITQFIKQ